MAASEDVQLSKYLSWVLRHAPDAVGLHPTAQGWVRLDALVAAAAADGRPTSADRIRQVVARDDKQRFALSADGSMIRAQQGHSIRVDLGYTATEPPALLFHGTVAAAITSILEQGLRRGKRHHVHLSHDEATAARVGARRREPFILTVRAGAMAEAGFRFFRTPNGVWLVEQVPPRYIDLPSRPAP